MHFFQCFARTYLVHVLIAQGMCFTDLKKARDAMLNQKRALIDLKAGCV